MSKTISTKLLRVALQKEPQPSNTSPNEAFAKLEKQLKNYHRLPSLNQIIDKKLYNLVDEYSVFLETTKADNVQSLMMKFMPQNNQIINNIKLNNLKAHIIKHEIQREYISIRSLRKSSISIDEDSDISMEYTVQTYLTKNMIEFVKLLHDDAFFHSSHINYYRRFMKLFQSVVNDNNISKGHGFCRKLRPVDLEKLIQLLIYSNSKLTLKERQDLKLSKINTLLITDLKNSDLKLSNKELFSLLELSFIESRDPKNKSTATVQALYESFKNGHGVEKGTDFFKSFLNYNLSLSINDSTIYDKEFTTIIIEDILNHKSNIDRGTLKYMLKYAGITENHDMSDVVNNHILNQYSLDKDTLNMMQFSLPRTECKSDVLKFVNEINYMYTALTKTRRIPEIDSFQLRLLDHLLAKEGGAVPGFIFQQHSRTS